MREKILLVFLKKDFFPSRVNVFITKEKEKSKENKFFEYIENETKSNNYDLFKDYFNFAVPTDLAKKTIRNKG